MDLDRKTTIELLIAREERAFNGFQFHTNFLSLRKLSSLLFLAFDLGSSNRDLEDFEFVEEVFSMHRALSMLSTPFNSKFFSSLPLLLPPSTLDIIFFPHTKKDKKKEVNSNDR